MRPVRLVNHKNDVIAGIQHAIDLAELINGGDENLAHIALEELDKLLFAGRARHVGNVRRIECGGNLRFEVDTVIDNHHGRVFEFRHHAQLLRGEKHQQRFAASLKMPDQSLFGINGFQALHNEIRSFEMLI